MKKIIVLTVVFLIFGCKSKAPEKKVEVAKIEKLSLSEVNNNQIQKAYDLGKRILMTCNTSKFKPFNETEATSQVIKNTTQDRLTKTCLKFRLKYGDFIDIQLVEIYRNPNDDSLIFRYKALYQKKIANKELQVTLNNENKVSSIKSKDWTTTFE